MSPGTASFTSPLTASFSSPDSPPRPPTCIARVCVCARARVRAHACMRDLERACVRAQTCACARAFAPVCARDPGAGGRCAGSFFMRTVSSLPGQVPTGPHPSRARAHVQTRPDVPRHQRAHVRVCACARVCVCARARACTRAYTPRPPALSDETGPAGRRSNRLVIWAIELAGKLGGKTG